MITLTPPGTPFNLGQDFSLLPNNMARLGEEFFVTNGGAVRRANKQGKEENIVRLTVKVKRTMSHQSESISMIPGATQSWGGFKITLVTLKPTNEIVLRIVR